MLNTKSQPLVSVIIPAYNCARYISESVKSALEQDYPNKEIIVVDDGSTDNTVDILSLFGDSIILIKQKNAGPASAKNTGIKISRGDFVAFLDADDVWFPGKLSLQIKHMSMHPETGLVYHNWMTWKPSMDGTYPPLPIQNTNTEIPEVDPKNSGWIYRNLLSKCIIHTTTVLIRRDILNKVGWFNEDLYIGEDYYLWLKVSRITKIDKLTACLSAYRINPESITNRPVKTNYEAMVITKAIKEWGYTDLDGKSIPRCFFRKRLADAWGNFAYQHYKKGDPWIAVRAYANAFGNDPLNVRLLSHLLASIAMLMFKRRVTSRAQP